MVKGLSVEEGARLVSLFGHERFVTVPRGSESEANDMAARRMGSGYPAVSWARADGQWFVSWGPRGSVIA